MRPLPSMIYFPDIPVTEQPFASLAGYAQLIHLYVPTEELPGFLMNLRDSERVRVHRTGPWTAKELRPLVADWQRWAEAHQKADWEAMKLLYAYQAQEDEEQPAALAKAIRFPSGPQPNLHQDPPEKIEALGILLARSYRTSRAECSDLLSSIRDGEERLQSLLRDPEDDLSPSPRAGAGFDLEHADPEAFQLASWGRLFTREPVADLPLVTDQPDWVRCLTSNLEAKAVAEISLPLLHDGFPSRDDSAPQAYLAFTEEWSAAFDQLDSVRKQASPDNAALDSLRNQFITAAESMARAAEQLRHSGSMKLEFFLLERRSLETLLRGRIENSHKETGLLGTAPWCVLLSAR